MNIDLDFIKDFLNVFKESDKAHIDYRDLVGSSLEVEIDDQVTEKFIFHVQLILDNQLIGTNTGSAFNLKDIGFTYSKDGQLYIGNIPLRLTQTGHDFLSSLNNKEVMSKLKTEFKDAPFKTVFDGGQKLLNNYFKKKMDAALAEE